MSCYIDNGRKYTETHEWAALTGNTAIVGISDYAQDKLGDVVYVDLPEIGAEFSKEGQLSTNISVYSFCLPNN